MRVLLLTLGSRGDVEPFVALAAALQRAGHQATLAAATRFHPLAQAHGVTTVALGDGFIELMESAEGRAALDRGGSLFGTLRTMQRLAQQADALQLQVQREAWAAAQDCQPQLVVHHLKVMGAADIAQRLGVPSVLALLVPLLQPTAAWPCPMLPAWSERLPPAARRGSYHLVNWLATRFGAGAVKRWRREEGLPPRPARMDQLHDAEGRPVPLLHAHSEVLLPRPADWPAHAVATGAWRLPTSTRWQPSPALQAFLDAGPPPVYVGFGSMVGRHPVALAQRVITALARAGVRGVIARGWGGLQPQQLPPEVHLIDEAPHDVLLPQMAAVVHHGGAGTTVAGLLAGLPTVVCPFFGDQPFWGRTVHRLGVGPAPVPARQLDPVRLAAAIGQAVNSPAMRDAAYALGQRLRAEDGTASAVRFLERLVSAPQANGEPAEARP